MTKLILTVFSYSTANEIRQVKCKLERYEGTMLKEKWRKATDDSIQEVTVQSTELDLQSTKIENVNADMIDPDLHVLFMNLIWPGSFEPSCTCINCEILSWELYVQHAHLAQQARNIYSLQAQLTNTKQELDGLEVVVEHLKQENRDLKQETEMVKTEIDALRLRRVRDYRDYRDYRESETIETTLTVRDYRDYTVTII